MTKTALPGSVDGATRRNSTNQKGNRSMKTERITRAVLRAINADIDSALQAVAKKHGLQSLKTSGASFADGYFITKVKGVVEGGKTAEAERYELKRQRLDLPPLGTVFIAKGTQYIITGLSTTGAKILFTKAGTDRPYSAKIAAVKSWIAESGVSGQAAAGHSWLVSGGPRD